jgi:hypothetical protein
VYAKYKKLWLEALRSGEFKQGQKCLRSFSNGEPLHCCLGVLVEVVERDTKDTVWEYSDWLEDGHPSLQVQEIVGWKDLDAISTCVDLNDVEKKDFDFIADYIEQNVPAKEIASGPQ